VLICAAPVFYFVLLCGYVVECWICNREVVGFESRPVLLHTKVCSVFHPSRVGNLNEYQL